VNAQHAFLLTPEDTNGDGTPDLWYRGSNADGANDLMRDLGSLSSSGANSPIDINNAGQIVGYEQFADGTEHFYLWQDGAMTELAGLGAGADCGVGSINDAGQVIGSTGRATGSYRWFLWRDGVKTDLGPGLASDINASGQVL